MRDCRHIVVVSDIHAGSAVAVAPPSTFNDNGQEIRSSVYQRALYAQWRVFWDEFVPHATGGEPYAVVVNGDATEGDHHKTKEVTDPNEHAHVKIAHALLQPVADKAERVIMVRGTEAHVGLSAALEEALAGLLEADTLGQRNRSHWEAWLELGPHLCHFAHHIGTTSSTAYEHSALSRELAANLLESAQWGNRPADVIVRSHRHRYSSATLPTSNGSAELIVTPSWQLRTAFAWKKVSMRLPQIGGVVLGYDKFGFFKRAYVWVPPRQGPTPLSKASALRTLTGRRSSKASPSRKRATG